MIKLKFKGNKYTITNDFDIIGKNPELIERFVEGVTTDPSAGNRTLNVAQVLKEIGAEIIKVKVEEEDPYAIY